MLTRFLASKPLVKDIASVDAGVLFYISRTNTASRYLMTFECADPADIPRVTKRVSTVGAELYEALEVFGSSSGVMIAPFVLNTTTTAFIEFSEDVKNVKVYETETTEYMCIEKSVGPVSINTIGPETVAPFTVMITCKPLFLEKIPFLIKYSRPAGNATNLDTFNAGLVTLSEAEAIENILNKKVKYTISYEYSSHVGIVVSATLKDTSVFTKPEYTLVGDLVVGIPSGGQQESITVGAENPANYTKRAYVPRYGSYTEMNFSPMEPFVLECTELGEIQAAGKLRYEHSHLLIGEAPVSHYIVTAHVLNGAGNVAVYDNSQEFAELPEYEY